MDLLTAIPELAGGTHLVAFIGAGGKSTAIRKLAIELCGVGRNVLITTTTRMMYPEKQEYDYLHLGDYRYLVSGSTTPSITVAAEIGADQGKMRGYLPEQIDAIHRAGIFDVILTEADGARMKPIKAPAPYEPVVPAATTLAIGLTGFDSFFRPANDKIVHRLRIFLDLTGMNEADFIDERVLLSLVGSPEGLFKGIGKSVPKFWLINKVDTDDDLERCRIAVRSIFPELPGITRVLCARLQASQAFSRIRYVLSTDCETAEESDRD